MAAFVDRSERAADELQPLVASIAITARVMSALVLAVGTWLLTRSRRREHQLSMSMGIHPARIAVGTGSNCSWRWWPVSRSRTWWFAGSPSCVAGRWRDRLPHTQLRHRHGGAHAARRRARGDRGGVRCGVAPGTELSGTGATCRGRRARRHRGGRGRAGDGRPAAHPAREHARQRHVVAVPDVRPTGRGGHRRARSPRAIGGLVASRRAPTRHHSAGSSPAIARRVAGRAACVLVARRAERAGHRGGRRGRPVRLQHLRRHQRRARGERQGRGTRRRDGNGADRLDGDHGHRRQRLPSGPGEGVDGAVVHQRPRGGRSRHRCA